MLIAFQLGNRENMQALILFRFSNRNLGLRRLKGIIKCLALSFVFLNGKKVKASNGFAKTNVLFDKMLRRCGFHSLSIGFPSFRHCGQTQ
jgi:hypothetical protein